MPAILREYRRGKVPTVKIDYTRTQIEKAAAYAAAF